MSEDIPESIGALLSSDVVTGPTRAALQSRLGPAGERPPQFFTAGEYETLRAVAGRFFPEGRPSAVARALTSLDGRLAQGGGDGWRYEALPPDAEAIRRGLHGLGADFAASDAARQDAVLTRTQSGREPGEFRFFEELLAELTGYYYSDPEVQIREAGALALADGWGWERLGLNAREAWEPAPHRVPVLAPTPPIIPRPAGRPDARICRRGGGGRRGRRNGCGRGAAAGAAGGGGPEGHRPGGRAVLGPGPRLRHR